MWRGAFPPPCKQALRKRKLLLLKPQIYYKPFFNVFASKFYFLSNISFHMLPEEVVLVFYHCLLNFISRLINLLEDEAASTLVSSKTCLHSSSHDHSSIFFNTDVVICLHNVCPTHKSARFVTFCFFLDVTQNLHFIPIPNQ